MFSRRFRVREMDEEWAICPMCRRTIYGKMIYRADVQGQVCIPCSRKPVSNQDKVKEG